MYQGIITAVVLIGIGYMAGCYSVFALPVAHAETVQSMTENSEFQNLYNRMNQLPVRGKK